MRYMIIFVLLFLFEAAAGQDHVHFYWAAFMNEEFTLENGEDTYFWGFGTQASNRPTLPGPKIEVNQFDTVTVHLINLSPESHTIHLHGLDVDTPNDGVPHTSFPIIPNDSTTYTFVANHHGTFLYHCHVMTTLHLAMGMYGMVVVHPPNPYELFPGGPAFLHEYHYLFSEMNSAWNDNQLSPGPFHLYEADVFLVNGFFQTSLDEEEEEHIFADPVNPVLLRLGNVAYSKVIVEIPEELNVTTYMADGRILPASLDDHTLELYPGERYSTIISSDQPYYGDISVVFEDVRDNAESGELFIPVSIDIGLLTEGVNSAPNLSLVNHPFSNQLEVISEKDHTGLRIIKTDGRIVRDGIVLSQGFNSIPINLPTGMYFFSGPDFTLKFIVTR